ncbi:uncharacterized protein Z520_07699 [Fonsecaea multimorphosa CBS 102226]|uniref:Shikimate dehydrogenase substrate binding N-terminal domain-containing protein n=1 Tax=Fonsecaea multimorphosa CBS 102226 TaxID=1442371 RepID=A0A0D2KIK3_9EURO|nr:uncharacterized protein Z520_07699 [Fonsecaea multimorphosa CBS 102226]KIX96433.1 hypothetical protein Z520_07699 [Fonsecaea multimorphosa CBS 102226]OAL22344.1 hypothetical protein AYO22_07388 [Fonsecaea multimorphosa]
MAISITSQVLRESYEYGDSPHNSSSRKEQLKTFLFGYPISHSLAPTLHSTIWERLQVPWTYSLVESLDMRDFLPKLNSTQFVGSAVTMPHKVSVLDVVDDTMEDARMIGAINTIIVRCDKSGRRQRIGANTDCIGIYEALERNFPNASEEIGSRPGLVIGGGGACRSALYALWKFFNIQELYLVNRAEDEAENVISSFRAAGVTAKITHVQTVEQAKACCLGVASVIGTIPDIPPKTAAEAVVDQIVMEILHKPTKGYLMDMCYTPKPVTHLLRAGLENGWSVITGIEPLIYQGIAQQVLWLEMEIDHLPVEEAARRVRDKVQCGESRRPQGGL